MEMSHTRQVAIGLRNNLQHLASVNAWWKNASQSILLTSIYAIPPQKTLLDMMILELSEQLRVFSNLVEREINQQELTPERVIKVANLEPDLCEHCTQFRD